MMSPVSNRSFGVSLFRNISALVLLVLMSTGCGLFSVPEAIGEGVGTALADGIGDALVPPTAVEHGARGIDGFDLNQTRFDIFSKQSNITVREHAFPTVEAIVFVFARKSDEVQNYIKNTKFTTDAHGQIAEIGELDGYKDNCFPVYVNEKLQRVDGACVTAIDVDLPAERFIKVYVNGVPVRKEIAFVYDAFMVSMERLKFVDAPFDQRQKTMEAFRDQDDLSKITVRELLNAVLLVRYYDDRLKGVSILAPRVSDRENAELIAEAFGGDKPRQDQAIRTIRP